MTGHDQVEGTWDESKGKAKEAAGDLTDNERLQREGKEDQVKGRTEKAVGHLKDVGEDVKEAVKDVTDR